MTPLTNRVLVRRKLTEEVTAGGIILPEKIRKDQDMTALWVEIVKLGESAFHGYYVKPEEGDTVAVSRYAGSDHIIESDDEYEYRLVHDEDITMSRKDIDIEQVIKEGRENE